MSWSWTDDSITERRNQVGKERRSILNMIRKMLVTVTRGPLWQFTGTLLMDPTQKETVQAEVFDGIGHAARPKAGANAEGIIVHVGAAAEHPVCVGTRDEGLRKAVVPDMLDDETATFNSATVVYHRKTGVVEIRTTGGTALALPTMADFNALRSWVAAQFTAAGHTHTVSGGTTTAVAPISAPGATPPTATGTTVLKTH